MIIIHDDVMYKYYYVVNILFDLMLINVESYVIKWKSILLV